MGKKTIILWLFSLLLTLSTPASGESVRGNLEERFSHIPRLEYQGTTYRFRSRLTVLLLLGVDAPLSSSSPLLEYRNGGQADFLLLLVVDDNAKTIAPLHLNRDSMAQVTVLNVLGQASGTGSMQLCLSHGFGDGKEQSCLLTLEAVERLLLDTPIDHYAALHMSGIAPLNDALGGVTVTLTEDMTALDPALKQGETVRLQGMQAEYFVRQRFFIGDGTNQSRMARQHLYLTALKDVLKEKLAASPAYIGSLYDQLLPYLTTDMSRGYLINLASKAERYEVLPIRQLEGETRINDAGFRAFYPDPESILKTVIDVFYTPVI